MRCLSDFRCKRLYQDAYDRVNIITIFYRSAILLLYSIDLTVVLFVGDISLCYEEI